MDRLKYEIVSLKSGKQYFILEELFYDYEMYLLGLNLDDSDVKIFIQEVKNGKNVLREVEDASLLSKLSKEFEEKVKDKILSIN